jgi:hypothetical protein
MFAVVSATTPAAPGDPVVLAAGDIADCNASGDSATAAVLDANPEGVVLTLGDNAYENGTSLEFAQCYDPTWGRHKSRTFPAPGNHEYNTPNAAGYFGYFGSAAGPDRRGYYSFDLGSWHVVSLNSERDTGATGAQVAWLRADLAGTSADCVLAYWHTPRWTAGKYGDSTAVQQLWNVLYDSGADVVLAGHDHNYQRYPQLNKAGAPDPGRGIRSFVVGSGGRHLYPLRADARRETGEDTTFGVLKLTLHAGAYSWRFLGVAGSAYTDAGSGACSASSRRPSAPPASPPPPPSPPATPPPPPSSPPPAPEPPPPALTTRPTAPPAPRPQGPPSPRPLPQTSAGPPAPSGSPSVPPAANAPQVNPPSAPPPAPPPPVRRTKPRPLPPRIGHSRVIVSAYGTGRVWLACPRRGPTCRGRLTLRVLRGVASRPGTRVASGTFAVRSGAARVARITLTSRGVDLLARRGRLRGRLVASPSGGRPAAARRVELVLAQAKTG